MFNFNTENEKPLNKENLFKEIDSYTIFRHYLGAFKLGRAISSPFREDNNPSFTINYNKVTSEFFFHDKVLGGGDSISLVSKLYNLNFRDSLIKIANDLGVANKFAISNNNKNINTKKVVYKVDIEKLVKESENEIKVKSREFQRHDLGFWKQFGITKETLKKYNVTPISHIFYTNNIVKTDQYAYCFKEYKDGKESLTIYQPFNKDKKWIKTHDASVWYGWDQLPKKGKDLIITKSRKDIMSIIENTNFPSTGLQNEKVFPKENVVRELFGRFDTIFILYDNDFDKETNWGREAGKKLEERFGFVQIEIPTEYKCKDFSDLVKKYGVEKSKEILEDQINNAILF